jgi:hypothetical protein
MDEITADIPPPITDGSDEYIDDEVITGSNQKDEIVAGVGNHFVEGQDGSDSIWREAGDDTLSGGAGENDLYGDAVSDFLDDGEGGKLAYGRDSDGTVSSGPGDDLLTAGGGFDTVAYWGRREDYRITTFEAEMVVSPQIDGVDALHSVEKPVSADRQKQFVSHNPWVTTSQPSLNGTKVSTDASTVLAEYQIQLSEGTVKHITLITQPQFTSVYPDSLSTKNFASQLVANVVKDSATAQAKANAIADIEAAIGIGWTRGDFIYRVFGNLATKPLQDREWGNTALQFRNQLEVARYLTETLHYASEDVEVLRQSIANVTKLSDVSTIENIVELIGTLPPGV